MQAQYQIQGTHCTFSPFGVSNCDSYSGNRTRTQLPSIRPTATSVCFYAKPKHDVFGAFARVSSPSSAKPATDFPTSIEHTAATAVYFSKPYGVFSARVFHNAESGVCISCAVK